MSSILKNNKNKVEDKTTHASEQELCIDRMEGSSRFVRLDKKLFKYMSEPEAIILSELISLDNNKARQKINATNPFFVASNKFFESELGYNDKKVERNIHNLRQRSLIAVKPSVHKNKNSFRLVSVNYAMLNLILDMGGFYFKNYYNRNSDAKETITYKSRDANSNILNASIEDLNKEINFYYYTDSKGNTVKDVIQFDELDVVIDNDFEEFSYTIVRMKKEVIANISKQRKNKYDPNKKQGLLLSHRKYLDLISYWNSLENVSKVRLPKDEAVNYSKTVIKLCKHFNQIEYKNFIKKNKVTNIPDNLISFKWDDSSIKNAMLTFDKIKSKDYKPVNKKFLPKTLNEFVLSYNKNESFLYKTLNFKLEHVVTELPTNRYDASRKYFHAFHAIKAVDKLVIRDMEENLYRTYMDIYNNVSLCYSRGKKWDSYFSTYKSFTELHLTYLNSYPDLKFGHLNCGLNNKVWLRFIAWIEDGYGIKLYPSIAEKKVLYGNRKISLIRSGSLDDEDFTEFDGMLTKSDIEYAEKLGFAV